MDRNFPRVDSLPPYVFAEINRLKSSLRQDGHDVIDFGMGNPDMEPPAHVVEKLVETAQRAGTSRYSASAGIPGLRAAQARYYERTYGVKLDVDSEIVVSLGSKEGFANLAMAITAPGDVFVVPNPAYPIHPYGFLISGGSVRHVQAFVDGAFDPEHYLRHLDQIMRTSVPKPKAIVVNFPSNPTSQVCSLDFYKDLVAFAKKHGVWLISDLAYSQVYFGDEQPPSILQVQGAKDVAVEFTSLSKTFSMAGWRIGFAVGNPDLVGALRTMKSYLDYGAYTPIQVAACAALDNSDAYVSALRSTYRERRDVLMAGLHKIGWDIQAPEATMFAWAKIPKPYSNMSSFEFARRLLTEAHVSVAPGAGFGEYGEGYVRIGMVENVQRIRQATRQMGKFMTRD